MRNCTPPYVSLIAFLNNFIISVEEHEKLKKFALNNIMKSVAKKIFFNC